MSVCFRVCHVESTVMQPYPFYPLFFSERIPEVDPTMSAAIYGDLQAVGIMNATGFTSYPTDQPEDVDRECAFGLRCRPYGLVLEKFALP